MARRINSRLRINGTLQAETPLHVGGYGVDVDTDLPLARNGKNQLYVSGTSITGVLRAWCENNFGNVDSIFGFQEKVKSKVGTKEDKSHASFVLIEDAVVTLPTNLQTEIRDGVGIDRFYGTAADKSKFDRAVLPKGSTLNFEITVEIGEKHKPAETKAIFGHLLEALQNSEIRFGASKTRGLGKVRLQGKTKDDGSLEITTDKKLKILEEKFNSFDSILALFDGTIKPTYSIQDLIAADDKKLPKPAKPKLEIEIVWQPTLPLMNKAGYEGIGVDMLPVTSGVADGRLSLVLAGSSIKGAFRSQAERIVRTLLYCDDKTISDCEERNKKIETKGKNFNYQIDSIPFVEEIFGARKKTGSTNPKLGLGALSIDDCYAKDEFAMNAEHWREVEQGKLFDDKSYFEKVVRNETGREVEEVTLHRALRKIDLGKDTLTLEEAKEKTHKFHISHHTAIDRFTGGVADGALYSVLAPHNIEWQPIKMSLDFGRTGENDKCCLMLLLLVLRDLADNRLPLGFATNRGMGEVKIETIEIKGSYSITWKDKKFIFTDEKQKTEITGEWQKWAN